MRVLQISHKMPYPPLDGGAQLINNTTKGLIACGVDLTLLAINTPKNPADLTIIPEDYITKTKLIVANIDTRIKPLGAFLNLFQSQSYFIKRFHSNAFSELLKTILFNSKFDVIQLEHLYLCIYLDVLRKYSDAKIVLRAQNIEYVVWKSYLKGCTNFFEKYFISVATERLKTFETAIASKPDGIIAVTNEDAQAFKQFFSHANVTTIPMGFDFTQTVNYDFEKQYSDFPTFYHLGSMDWLPNEQAIDWFFKNISPVLIKRFPHIRIFIAGRKMQQQFYSHSNKNIIVEGEVSTPLKFQEDKAVMFVPLLSGSGIRAKIVEGMALGKTIISTTLGATGIEYENNKNILIADTPEEFATQTEKCFDKCFCRMIGHNAKETALKNYHYKICAEKMIAYYSQL